MPADIEYGIVSIPGGVSVRIYVAPRASANRIVGTHNGSLKVALTAPPVDGAANKALVEFMAKELGVPRRAVTIVSGTSSRNKTLRVIGVTVERVLGQLLPGD
jgi:uncharacterized protein (TIGR00251 family)